MTINETQLMNLHQLLRAAQKDCDFLSVEEIDDLLRLVDTEIYCTRLVHFVQELDNTIHEAMYHPELNEELYSKQWTICFDHTHLAIINNDINFMHRMSEFLHHYIDFEM